MIDIDSTLKQQQLLTYKIQTEKTADGHVVALFRDEMKTFNEFVGFFKKKKESPKTPPPPVYSSADIQRAYGVAPRTKDGRGTKSTVPGLSGPSSNRVGSVNRSMNRFANTKGYQSTIGRAEHGGKDDQYNVVFGGGTFDTTKGHPDKVVDGGKYSSAAAGKYQFMPGTWKGVTGSVKTPMTRSNQDKAATSLIKSRGVNLDLPMTRRSVNKLSGEWASLPDKSGKSRYGQPVKSYSQLRSWFNKKKSGELGPNYRDAPGANYAR
tara:strand:- start:554 stop:1348 length:795 start_codon:yes stop_codon:yes gene_type:complete